MDELIVRNGDQKIWTQHLGLTSNIPILWIAGAGAHAHFWTDSFFSYFLKQNYFLIRYDHRDVGLSSASHHDYDLYELAKDALSILDAYQIKTAHIVGHSMGGYIAQVLSSNFEERLLSQTILSAGPLGMVDALKEPLTASQKDILFETWKLMLQNRPTDNFEESWEGYFAVWKRLMGKIPIDEGIARKYTRELFTRSLYPAAVHKRHMTVMEKMAAELENQKEVFSKIVTPTLILHGEEDYLMLPEKGGIALSQALPKANLEMIPKMGHMLFNYDLEKTIAEKIFTFLHQIK